MNPKDPNTRKTRRPLTAAEQARANARREAIRRQNRQQKAPASSVERLMRIERRKARSRAVFISTLVLTIMLLMSLAILFVMQKTKPRPQFLFIQNGELTHSVEGRALILRDDSVLSAPADGLLKPIADEGTRVARGQKLALVIPTGLETQLEELQKCELDITDLQNELMNQGKGAGARAIYNESAVALSAIVNLIRSDMLTGDLSSLPTYTASLSVIIDQRSGKLATIDFHDARLDQLLAQKTGLEQSLGLASGTLLSDRPGVVSFHLDGYEAIFNEASIETLSIDQYRDALKTLKSETTAVSTVKSGTEVLRVTSGLRMYLAVYLNDIQSGSLDENSEYLLRVAADGTEIEGCKIVRSESDSDGTLVIFSADRKIEWFADRRSFQTEVAISTTKGMKIPRVALIDFDPQLRTADILIVNGGYTRQVTVDIVDYDREYVIIAAQEDETISESSEDTSNPDLAIKPTPSTVIVVNPDSIAAGEFIGDE